ncbi:unnamed protein product [Allacma fusca]|uniref:Carboxylic ester hydrolase n=1 Tax=Allacma fusca TaxID=39272 RepID=A0A8J2KVL9_9HEXA|nr:unnamed protein product [Allacma fusca]
MEFFEKERTCKIGFLTTVGVLLPLAYVTFNHLIVTAVANESVLLSSAPGGSQGKSVSEHPCNLIVPRINKVVETSLGQIEGTVEKSRKGRCYLAFRNIPYAKPPINELRFKDPEPAEPWTGVRDGSKFGSQCTQVDEHNSPLRAVGEEDCLHLNIYTPQQWHLTHAKEVSKPKVPVMVYIHGGRYVSGNGSRYGPDYFMDEDVVLITFQFRLGVFGFSSTDDDVIPGNMGFKDIIMLLRWVQQNIQRFGGDPEKVTVFGNSSGAITVHALLLSKMSKGLFQRAISQSGTLLVPGGPLPFWKPNLENIGKAIGCNNTADSMVLTDCLRGVDSKELVMIQGPCEIYGPIVETVPENGIENGVFISASTMKLLNDADNYPMKVPWLLGDVSAEKLISALDILREREKINALNENWVEESKSILEFRKVPSDETLLKIRQFYFQGENITNSTRSNLVNVYSDSVWVHSTKMAAMAHARHGPVYLYWLTREAAKSFASESMKGYDPPFGVCHGDELQYLFLYNGFPEIPIESTHAKFSQKLVRNWAVFADTGKPEIPEWAPLNVKDNGEKWFQLDDDTNFTSILKYRIRFWDDYINEIYPFLPILHY